MSDLLDLIRKTQPLYNHLSPTEAKILDEVVAAAHDLQEQLEKVSAACVVVVQERDALQKQCEARAIAMRDHADKIEIVRRLREECPGQSLYSAAADALEKQVEWNRLRAEDIITLGQQVGKLEVERDALREQLVKTREALQFYCDEAEAIAKNMRLGTSGNPILASLTVLCLDQGRRARSALTDEEGNS